MAHLIISNDDRLLIREFTGMCFVSQLGDAQLTFYIDSQEALAMSKIGFKLYDKTVTEYYDGDDTKWLALDHFPVRAVNYFDIVEYNPSGGTHYAGTACFHVYYDKSMIYLRDGKFPDGVHNIEVNYTYGAPAASDADRFALAKNIVFKSVCKDVLLHRGVQDSSGIESEKLEQYSITYGKGPFSMTIAQLDRDIENAYKALGITVEARIF